MTKVITRNRLTGLRGLNGVKGVKGIDGVDSLGYMNYQLHFLFAHVVSVSIYRSPRALLASLLV